MPKKKDVHVRYCAMGRDLELEACEFFFRIDEDRSEWRVLEI